MATEDKKKVRYKLIWNMIWPSAKKTWKFLPLFFILASVLAIFSVAEPYIFGSIVDSIVTSVDRSLNVHDAFSLIIPFLLIWGGLVIFETSLSAIYMYASWLFGNTILGNFLREIFARLLCLDIERFKSERSGELLRKFDNTWDSIWNINYNIVRTYLEALTRFSAALVVGLTIDWRLTLVSLIPVPLAIAIGALNMRAASKHQHGVNKFWEKISGHVSDAFSNIATIKSFSLEPKSIRTFAKLYADSMAHQMKVNYMWAGVEAGYGAIYITGRLCIFAAGAWFVLSGSTTIGTLIMFLGFANFLFGSVQMVMSTLPSMLKSLVYLDRATDYWFEVPEIQEKDDAIFVKRVKGEVRVQNVSFAYEKGKRVLSNVSFTIPRGKMYALVGQSGAGKSTIAQMFLRYYDPSSGQILIDGLDIRDFKLKSLRNAVGFVMQENLLFHDSIINNIKMGKVGATQKEIELAAKRAQAHGFIKKLKNGYGSVVGERGVKLSGGEKQRVALARVFLEDPPILVLDEATSALDSKTEHDLQAALKEVMKGRTSLVIAHRLSTVMEADQIIVMDKGRVVDQGTHEELINKPGPYKEYWQIQAGGYV